MPARPCASEAAIGAFEVREIANLRVRQLLYSASAESRDRFTRSQLNRLRDEGDFRALRDTLLAWCDGGFSLVETARRLEIHRNTVIYRLAKIAKVTRRDVRTPRTAISLYLACIITDPVSRPADSR